MSLQCCQRWCSLLSPAAEPAEPTEDGGVGIVMHFAGYKVKFLSFTSSAAGVGYIVLQTPNDDRDI